MNTNEDSGIDPKAELQRLIDARTCDCCTEVQASPDLLRSVWCRSITQCRGYIRKHWAVRRICPVCDAFSAAFNYRHTDSIDLPSLYSPGDIVRGADGQPWVCIECIEFAHEPA